VARVRAENLYKIFGRRPEQALRRLESGASREEVRAGGATPAVIDASFQVGEGEIYVVMGLSGSGKSTLIRMINGLWEPTSGRVVIDDEVLTDLPPKRLREVRARKISMVFQHFALFPHRTVLENAAYGLNIQGMEKSDRESRGRESLRLVGLEGWEDHKPRELSGGMQQRVGLARALATDADVLLMDEAFSALDPLIRREMQDQLLELQATLHKTIVFITHDLNEAMRLGDRIAVMRDGRIVQEGTAEQILNDPANDYVASFIQDVDRTRVLTASSVMEEPHMRIGAHEGPRAALRTMRQLPTSALFVVGRDRRLMGAVRDDAVAQAVRAGGQESLEPLVDGMPERVSPDTPLADLFATAAESPLPLAVVDEDQRLLGVIPRVTLLAALGGTDHADPHDATEPPSGEEVSHVGT
jgi:glycine betaine/proline transport system ATP-binding protein